MEFYHQSHGALPRVTMSFRKEYEVAWRELAGDTETIIRTTNTKTQNHQEHEEMKSQDDHPNPKHHGFLYMWISHPV